MMIVTTQTIPGREVVEVFGLVRGSSVRARPIRDDISAFLTNIIGGEMDEYTKLLAESREQALDRMTEEAKSRGANAILSARFTSSEIAMGAAEVLVYGTAVRLAPAALQY